MLLSAKKRNRAFWLLQFLGWGFINIISIFVIKDVGYLFLFVSVLSGMFAGIFSTSLLRNYLKKYVRLESFGLPDLGKIVAATLVCTLVFAIINFGLGFLYSKYIPIENEHLSEMLKAYNKFWLVALNSLFLIFAWVVCYFAIKLLLKLNSDRIERLELNTSLKQAQLNTLRGQINPHFMFNSLNNIRGLMLEDVDKSRDMLTKLSEMLRYSLTKNDVDAIALEEELEMVANYIDLSKIQLEDRLHFIKDIDPGTRSLSIPPMIIQLLVENAAKHGISNLKDGGSITLKTERDEDELQILVKNTGQLRLDKNSTQLGLKNIRQRLRLLYGDQATFSLKEVDNEVVATIKIPLK